MTEVVRSVQRRMVKTAILFYDQREYYRYITPALETFFRGKGWRIAPWSDDAAEPDVFGGYGWAPGMQAAYARWPAKLLHLDAAFWVRDTHFKLTLGGRWNPLNVDRDYDGSRLAGFGVKARPSRKPGSHVLICGMGPKSVPDWGLKLNEWETAAVVRLKAAGATRITYRPKPTWRDPRPLSGCLFSPRGEKVDAVLKRVDAVVSHHSNCSVDAAVAGLPFYADTGIAKPLSVPTLEDVVGATAQPFEVRSRFLRQVAWHQWSLDEVASGAWLQPPAPLANHPVFSA